MRRYNYCLNCGYKKGMIRFIYFFFSIPSQKIRIKMKKIVRIIDALSSISVLK